MALQSNSRPRQTYGFEEIAARAARMAEVLETVKEAALRPDSKKVAPRLNQAQVANVLGITKSAFLHGVDSKKYPSGHALPGKTMYDMADMQGMARAAGLRHQYAPGHGIVMTVANFKGGVAKTSTTVTLAQYLAQRGLSCAILDMDPQASATTLFGLSPYLDVTSDESVAALFYNDPPDPVTLARPTYWPGIDIIPSNQHLYGKEFALAAAAPEWGGQIFEVLAERIEPLRRRYDVLLIDTQPSLGFLTSTAVFAADHLVVTVPPSNLDLASSVIFWSLLRDVMEQALKADGHAKRWEGVHVLLTRVDDTDKSTHFIRKLLLMGCEDWLLPDAIPATRVATTAASEFATVYDIERYEGSYRSIKRARELFDKAYGQFTHILNDTWDAWEANASSQAAVSAPVADLSETDASVEHSNVAAA
ncbi:AAA family ATPase [Metallibacterium scheffleri]|nr:AAA family ATPase [Metallibacterium scheffleri]